MELRCLRGHFLGEVTAKEAFELRVPCVRCKCRYLFEVKEGRIMVGPVTPATDKRPRIAVEEAS